MPDLSNPVSPENAVCIRDEKCEVRFHGFFLLLVLRNERMLSYMKNVIEDSLF